MRTEELSHNNFTPISIMTEEKLRLVYGLFKDNQIRTEEGEVIECITYTRVKREIEDKKGFFHLKISGKITDWTIFEYLLLDDPMALVSE
jgi:hypothetical protein